MGQSALLEFISCFLISYESFCSDQGEVVFSHLQPHCVIPVAFAPREPECLRPSTCCIDEESWAHCVKGDSRRRGGGSNFTRLILSFGFERGNSTVTEMVCLM